MKRVLYVEDNDQNFYLVNYILNAYGYQVVRACEGGEGVRLAGQEQFDLILLDIQLPVMDGYEAARELRKIPSCRYVPMVAVTSYAMPGDREKALESGCNGYIEKPINPDTFMDQIREYCESPNHPKEVKDE